MAAIDHRMLGLAVLLALSPSQGVVAANAANAVQLRPQSIECAQAIERYLPGAYYLCAGSREYREGDFAYAISLYESAARWGSKEAQYNLGLMYYQGRDVPRDEALGLAWLRLSAERPEDTLHRQVADAAWLAASPQLRTEASTRLAGLAPLYADAVARTRALKRFNRTIREVEEEADWRPFDIVEVDGMQPMRVETMLKVLNEGAADSLRRPVGRDGEVIVGEPDTVP